MSIEDKSKREESSQFVVIQLAGEEYGIPIMNIETLIRMPQITRVPRMPAYIEGIINLRGRIIPIIDLRKRFGFPARAWDDKTRIAVTDISRQSVGFIADGVSEVIRLARKQIDTVPPTLSRIGEEYIDGIGKVGDRIIILLNAERILSETEQTQLKKTDLEATPAREQTQQ
ncbi:MAG: chemotaxis protein CheW [Elusimicrobia bacterium]|nr:chemotaxis protein CheW [Elusimicrobiota bacterium]